MTARPAHSGAAIGLVAVVGAAAMTLWSMTVGRLEVDDAYISFRYAKNLCAGEGLRFNPGEAPVEGISNFFWTLLVTPLSCVASDPLPAVKGLGGLLLAASITASMWLVRRAGGSLLAAVLAAALLAASPTFVAWQFAGLEAPLVAALAVVGIAALDAGQRPWGAALAFAVLGVTRIDAPLLVAALVVGWAIGRRLDGAPWREVMRSAWPAAWVPASVWAVVAVIRRAWFGEWLPNTYYAKLAQAESPQGRGLEYLFDATFSQPWVWLVPVAALIVGVKAPRRGPTVGAALAVVAHAAYVVHVGGDWMPLHRFLVAVLPLGAALVALSMDRLPRRMVEVVAPLAVAATVVGSLAGLQRDRTVHNFMMSVYDTEFGRSSGAFLNEALPSDAAFATTAAGSGPFFSDRAVIDMLGLNDAHIARAPGPNVPLDIVQGHAKGDGTYVLDREPRAILFFWGRKGRPEMLVSDAMIVFDPRFFANYVQRTVSLELDVPEILLPHLPGQHWSAIEVFSCTKGLLVDRCGAPDVVDFHAWVRAPRDAVSTPIGTLARRVLDARDSGGSTAALSVIDAARVEFRQAGFEVVADAYEARFALERGDHARVADAVERGRARPGYDGRLFEFWVAVDSRFAPVLVTRE